MSYKESAQSSQDEERRADIKYSELSLRLEFFEGDLWLRSEDEIISDSIWVDGQPRTPLQVCYFALTERWVDDCHLIDKSEPITYNNMFSESDALALPETQLQTLDLLDFVGFDSESSELFWLFNKNFSGLQNALLQDRAVLVDSGDGRYANFLGSYYPYEVFEAEFFIQA